MSWRGGGGQRDCEKRGVCCGNVPVKNNANNNYCFLFRKAKYVQLYTEALPA